MFVSPLEPFKIIYSLFEHEYLGYLMESFAVQLNFRGEVTFHTQNVSSKNIMEFETGIDQDDVQLVKYMDSIQQDAIYKKFNTKKISPQEFFIKLLDPEKGEKVLRDTIFNFIEKQKKEIFLRIKNKSFFIMGNDGVATWKEVEVMQDYAKAYFHFDRQEEQTVYYPIIKCGSEKVKFQFKGGNIINDVPAALLLDDKLYLFDQYADGRKIKPFLNKPNIIIPKKIEDTYYQKFIVPLVANFNVFAKGFEIINEDFVVEPKLVFTEVNQDLKANDDIFGKKNGSVVESKFVFDLSFLYGKYSFRYEPFSDPSYVYLEKEGDNFIFHKIRKNHTKEREVLDFIKKCGLDIKQGRLAVPKNDAIVWLKDNIDKLKEFPIPVTQHEQNTNRYFLGYSKLEIEIKEKNDWFDILANVQFGSFNIPFARLARYILNGIKEFELPNGEMAVIPVEWFTMYSDLFDNMNFTDEDTPILEKYHVGIVSSLSNDGLATTVMSRKLETLKNFEEIEEIPLPEHFSGVLRPYQKAGYDWLNFLREFNFGGCLADDMGLGKTVTTLAFLQQLKEQNIDGAPHLLIMPTSLIYNWQKEAMKFTPKMKILIHFGPFRAKDTSFFNLYDMVICSYGILRLDIDFMKNFRFQYVILDESQAIKNPTSLIFKSVVQLNCQNRLILTGTPLENSTIDLWSQMSFINPGLLGSLSSFKNNFQQQIEKQKDLATTQKLFSKIKPFMLRRHKSQVAKDLPEKIETVQYCQMSDEQERLYEETKSYIRNQLIKEMGKDGKNKSNILVLQGLNKLRQIANNPKMVDPEYIGESGKDSDVMHKLFEVIEEGYKVLVFSQYVKHLTLIRKELDDSNTPYLYLDGGTKKRQELVDEFQTDETTKVFLISLKAGGVGLNLTAAEYVFILDPWWNPAIEAQAIDRAHRIGQKNTVFSYKFITKNSVEEKILDLQNSKKRLFDELITTEESFMKSLSETDILSLLD